MKNNKHTPEPFILKEGFILEKPYTTYEMMNENAKNWQHYCTYQLKANALSGQHRLLQLCSMQLGFDKNPGGLMNDACSALDTITVAVIDECADKACFHHLKLEVGDIVFFDDSSPYNFMTNSANSYVVLTIKKDRLTSLKANIAQALEHKIKDTHGDFSTLLHQVWHRFSKHPEVNKSQTDYLLAEEEMLSALSVLLKTQTPKTSKLTKGEKIALSIRDQVYAHMDGEINIASLAKQYHVTERTLQKSFQSLFGFSPAHFLRQMKLNLVYRDLKHANAAHTTVSGIAQRWGFVHMGHFSRHFKALFNENPSQILKSVYLEDNTMVDKCVTRQEEMK